MDDGNHRFSARECVLGLPPEPRPGIRPGPSANLSPERAYHPEVPLERLPARASETPLRLPDPQERRGEVATRVGPHELDAVMPVAEPDLDPVRELPRKRLPPSPIKTDRTQRRLHGNPAGFVEREEACHVSSIAGHWIHVCAHLERVRASFQLAHAVSATWPRHGTAPFPVSGADRSRGPQVALSASDTWMSPSRPALHAARPSNPPSHAKRPGFTETRPHSIERS